jgi:hypothetical protein
MDYATFSRAANRILTQFGTTGILSRTSPGTYDPATSLSTPVTTTQSVKAVAFPYPAEMIDGTMIQSQDLQVFLSALGVTEPQAADKLTFLGADYTVVKAKNYNPTGTPVLYELQVRK